MWKFQKELQIIYSSFKFKFYHKYILHLVNEDKTRFEKFKKKL